MNEFLRQLVVASALRCEACLRAAARADDAGSDHFNPLLAVYMRINAVRASEDAFRSVGFLS